MLHIYPELVEKIKNVNDVLKDTYNRSTEGKMIIRQKLEAVGADCRKLNRVSTDSLKTWLNGKEIAAVDGSVNQTKGEPPHILYLFQAIAKTTTGFSCHTSDVYTPLLEKENEEESSTHWRSYMLAKLELEAAYQLLEQKSLKLLIMDGALYHYRIDAPDEWERLRKKALENEVLLVGVSEEITTENLVTLEAFHSYKKQPYTYDRDLLFGVLQQDELLHVKAVQHKAGLQSVWARLSSDPAIIGFDLLEEQASFKEEIGNVLLTLTPKDGRGIPLWLDMIDREIRVTDKLVDALVEQYIDPELKHRFFIQKRNNRPY